MNDKPVASSLVSSDDVNGTAVYGAHDKVIGHIDYLMIDKKTGKVAYAVIGFGGFLGLGEEHYPVPWSALRYDVKHDGFVTDIDEATVKGAPDHNEDWHRDHDWQRRAFDHYGVPYYWL